jgi:glycosyltransferase involved in cell wall biosynthesis
MEIIRIGSEGTYPLEVWKNFKKFERDFAPDVIYEAFNKLPLFTPILTKKPKLIQMYHLWLFSIFREASFPVASVVWLGEQMLRVFYRKEQFAIISDSAKKELKTYGIKDEQIKIIYCGMDYDFYLPSAEREIEKNGKYLLYIGRLQKYKGVLDICEAFEKVTAKFPDLKLKIVGSGQFRKNLEIWISKRGLQDKISLLGFISEEEKLSLLQHAFLIVQPSYKEGWGLTVIEANACGVPVVANNAPGLCDSVSYGKTGLLYKYGDVEDAAKKIEEFLQNPQKYAEISANCRAWAEKFKWKTASDETLELLKKVCQN